METGTKPAREVWRLLEDLMERGPGSEGLCIADERGDVEDEVLAIIEVSRDICGVYHTADISPGNGYRCGLLNSLVLGQGSLACSPTYAPVPSGAARTSSMATVLPGVQEPRRGICVS